MRLKELYSVPLYLSGSAALGSGVLILTFGSIAAYVLGSINVIGGTILLGDAVMHDIRNYRRQRNLGNSYQNGF